jgi:subtilase family serine protease
VGADNFGHTAESNENNNYRSITFTVTAPPQADLVVSDLALWNSSVMQGQNLGFNYTVANDGAAQSNAGYSAFYIDSLDGAHYRGNNFTDAVGAGGSRALFNAFNTGDLSVGQHTLWVGADNFGHTAESNENNNYRSITFTVTAPSSQAGASVYMSEGGQSVSLVNVVSLPHAEWMTII